MGPYGVTFAIGCVINYRAESRVCILRNHTGDNVLAVFFEKKFVSVIHQNEIHTRHEFHAGIENVFLRLSFVKINEDVFLLQLADNFEGVVFGVGDLLKRTICYNN